MLDPIIATRLMADVPEMKQFCSYLASKALELNNLSEVITVPSTEIVVEVKARQLAYQKIVEILSPLLNTQAIPSVNRNKDYDVQ